MRSTELQFQLSQTYLCFLTHRECVHVCVRACVCMCVHTHGPSYSCSSGTHPPPVAPLRQSPGTHQSGWASQQTPGILLSPTPQYWDYKHTQLCLAFYIAVEDVTQVLIFQQALYQARSLPSPFRTLEDLIRRPQEFWSLKMNDNGSYTINFWWWGNQEFLKACLK